MPTSYRGVLTSYADQLLDVAPDAMIIVDSNGTIIYANHHAAKLFGYHSDELIGERMEMLVPERFRTTHQGQRASYSLNPRLRSMGENQQLYARHRNGSEFQVEIRLSGLQTADGLLVLSTIRDVTARGDLLLKAGLMVKSNQAKAKRQDQAHGLFEATEHAQAALHSIGDAVISIDPAGNVIYVNPIAEKMMGWSRADATGRPLREVLTITDDDGRKSVLPPPRSATEALNFESAAASEILTRRDGSEIAIEHSFAPMQNDDGDTIGAVIVIRDVSAARAIAQKLAYAAHHDALTGLPNRVLLESRLTQAIALASRHNCEAAVLFLDLDAFKLVNDTLGHAVGDRLLESVARLLQQCVRSTDTVSRFGGDEFVVLLSELSRPGDAVVFAQRILRALQVPHSVDQHKLMVTASIGIALYPHDGVDPQTLLRNADAAMFQAKDPGGNTYQLWNRSRKSA
jgi:diguanylate cyclase (GGDEF)-like protein/PAS domain S-box-containing protein